MAISIAPLTDIAAGHLLGCLSTARSAASRVLVAESVYESIRDRLVEAARSLRTGPADAPETQINPVIDAEARAPDLPSGASRGS